MKKTIVIASILLLIVGGIFFGGYSTFRSNEANSVQETSFIIEKPFISVIKNLATKDSLEKTIEESDGVLVEKNWDYLNLEVPRRILRIKDYVLNGKMNFVVEKNDSDLGQLRLPFVQNVHLDDQVFSIETSLVDAQKNILSYNKNIVIKPIDNNKTEVALKSEIKVKKFIPFFYEKYMNDKVEKNNKQDLEDLKNNLNEIANKKPTFEIKMK